MASAYGLHVGSTCACVAAYKDGITNVVANSLGERVTPCVVAFTDHDQTVGTAAKQGLVRNAQNTIRNITQIIGKKFEDPDIEKYKQENVVCVTRSKDGYPAFEVDYKGKKTSFTPELILNYIFKQLLETAQSHGGTGSLDAVIAVSPQFTENQKNSIRKSATAAGFNVLRIIAEPSSSVLAYDISQADKKHTSTLLVFRLGGTSSTASVIKVQNGIYKLEASVTDSSFGGNQFTQALADHLGSEFHRQTRLDIVSSRRALSKLRLAAENCKLSLSRMNNAQCAVESLHDGVDFQTNVSRVRLESLCQNLAQQCLVCIEKALANAAVRVIDVEKVILCGGGAKSPQIEKIMKEFFSSAEVLCNILPEEVIAVGAAKQAALLVGKNKEESTTEDHLFDCISKHICIKKQCSTENGNGIKLFPVFEKYTPVPCRYQESFTLGDKQTSIKAELLESDELTNVAAAKVIAKIVMKDLSPGGQISLMFHLKSMIDQAGIDNLRFLKTNIAPDYCEDPVRCIHLGQGREGSLHVTCVEESTQREESINIDVS